MFVSIFYPYLRRWTSRYRRSLGLFTCRNSYTSPRCKVFFSLCHIDSAHRTSFSSQTSFTSIIASVALRRPFCILDLFTCRISGMPLDFLLITDPLHAKYHLSRASQSRLSSHSFPTSNISATKLRRTSSVGINKEKGWRWQHT